MVLSSAELVAPRPSLCGPRLHYKLPSDVNWIDRHRRVGLRLRHCVFRLHLCVQYLGLASMLARR